MVTIEVHTMSPLLSVCVIDTPVRLVLSQAEGARVAKAGVCSDLQCTEPCLSSHIYASPRTVLTTPNQGEGFSRLAIVGRKQTPSSEDPAAQRIVLSFYRRL
jgi:hypothetical protein